ncbi:MAG TPA: hypothetical protein VHB20_02635, partial [Verrucomicrobiae bacterium]|nr:hypothetical protein [Verrucomicrobiae bacterium]
QQWGMKNILGQSTLLHHGYAAEVVANRNKVERNLRLLEKAIEELQDEPNLLMSYGQELARSGRFAAGLDQYIEALRCLSAMPPAEVTPELRETLLSQLTSHLMVAKSFQDVVNVWQTPVAKAADVTASQHFSLGLAYMELKQPALAAEHMRQCLAKRNLPALSPINREILKAGPSHCLALCHVALQETAPAAAAFQNAIAAEPQARAPRLDYARFLGENGKPIDALKWLNELVSEKVDDLPAWLCGGQIALSQAEFLPFACDWTGEAVKHFPAHPAILLQRAEALLLSQRTAEALPLWRDGRLPQNPRHAAARLLCEILLDETQLRFAPVHEEALSHETLKWCRRLIAVGANDSVRLLQQKIEIARAALPSFVAVWESAHKRAAASATPA